MDGGAKAGDDYPVFGAVEDLFHARTDGALALRVAGTIGVGGIAQQEKDAALAVVGEGVQVEELVIGGGGIDLEIARVDDDSERGGDGQRDRADNRVGYVDELDLERAYADGLLGLNADEARLLEIVLLHPALNQREREGGPVDRDFDLI